MNKVELAAAMATTKETTKKEAMTWLETMVEIVEGALVKGEPVKIAGFGTFETKERAQRNGVNPATGQTIVIEASKSPKFKASSVLKNKVNGK